MVVIVSITVAFAIGLVVLLIVAPQIPQCESIVGGDHVQRRLRGASCRPVNILAAAETLRKRCCRCGIPAPEAPYLVPIAAVEFSPRPGKSTNLVAIRTDIPWFRDHLHVSQHRVLR